MYAFLDDLEYLADCHLQATSSYTDTSPVLLKTFTNIPWHVWARNSGCYLCFVTLGSSDKNVRHKKNLIKLFKDKLLELFIQECMSYLLILCTTLWSTDINWKCWSTVKTDSEDTTTIAVQPRSVRLLGNGQYWPLN